MQAALHGPFGRIVLGSEVVTIGRALDNRLVVKTPMGSSHHAEIRPGSTGYILIDLGSTNGTFVNEQQLAPYSPRLLQNGDRVHIGDLVCMYLEDCSDIQMPFAHESGHMDVPTAKVRAIDVRAMGRSELFGDQPPAAYTYSPVQQPVPPIFTSVSGTSHTPQWAAESATGNSITGGQSVSPPFRQANGQNNTPPWATDGASGYGMPEQLQPYVPPAPLRPKSSNMLKVLLIVLSIVLILGAAGGGISAYMLTRPQPVIHVTSAYQVGSTPAGSTGTVLHVSARIFSDSSSITFLLDNLPVAGNQHVSSDASGNVRADLTITSDWAIGNHTLTAKDASGYTTKIGASVIIVSQGQAHTPGPHGAPPDDMSFKLYASVYLQDAGTGKQLGTYSDTLLIMGRPDPAGGTVCQYLDDGQPYTYLGNYGNGITYHETYVYSCSGTYKGGKLSYIETAISEKISYSNGLSCVAHTPFVHADLEGTFTNQNTVSGTLSEDSITWDCSGGYGTRFSNAKKGSWSAQLE